MAKLASIQIGQPQRYEPAEGELSRRAWTTAFYKQPVEGPIHAGRLGLEGDGVAETRVHGGPDKAVCCYSADRFAYWRERLGEPDFGPAAFGENFTLAGLDEPSVCLGDVWAIGDAEFEVSQPRQPCHKLARRWRVKELTLWVQQTGYSGWYLRVRREGTVRPGDDVRLVERPEPDWTIARANEVMYAEKDSAALTAELAAVGPLAASWKRQLKKRLS